MGIIYDDPVSTSGYGWWQPVYIQGSAPTSVEVQVTPEASTSSVDRLTLAVSPARGRDIVSFLNGAKVIQAESGTMGTDTSSTAVAAASGGNVARSTFATTATNAERFRVAVSSALKGTYDVYLWWKRSVGADTVYGQLKWGLGSGSLDRVANVESQVLMQQVVTNNGFVATKLGRINVPDDGASALTLSVWMERTAGTTTADADFIALVPSYVGDNTLRATDDYALLDGKTLLLGDGKAYRLESGTPAKTLSVAGSTMLTMEPGLNLVGVFSESTASGRTAFLTDTHTLRVIYSPQYYS